MKRLLLLLLIVVPMISFSQEIHFENGINWQQVQEKAKAENKYIFMDCYATWCVPCKWMEKNVYTIDSVGEYFNQNFVCVKYQMDSTAKDDAVVKSLYKDAHNIMTQYKVNSFPTYLFLDTNGKIVHKAGGSMPANLFISSAKESFDPIKQYYTLLKQYNEGKRDSALLWQLALTAFHTGDEKMKEFSEAYIKNVKNIYTKDNLEFVAAFTKSSTDKGFSIWLHHTKEVNAVMESDYAQRKVMNIISAEDQNVKAANEKALEGLKIQGYLGNQPMYVAPDKIIKHPSPPEWKKLYAGIKNKYGPYYADRITKWVKISYYKQRYDWTEYCKAVVDYLKPYKETVKPSQLNGYAWDIFTHSNNKKQLSTASQWSKETLNEKDKNVYAYHDTYANLLYKLNNTNEAIAQEETAIALAPEKERPGLEKTLEKIKKGEKTWEDE